MIIGENNESVIVNTFTILTLKFDIFQSNVLVLFSYANLVLLDLGELEIGSVYFLLRSVSI